MATNTSISLSTASSIENSIQYAIDGFSTVGTMGSLVNNQKFKSGYDDFAQRKNTQKSYIWQSLSAISEELGQSLYANIRDYIDNVSNVDACKIRALKSMMGMLNVDYSVLDRIGYYPIEIQHLIDILSISKKYLLSNKHIKQDFLDYIAADRYADKFQPSALISSEYFMSIDGRTASLSDECMLSIGIASSSIDYYKLSSDAMFEAYLSGIYNNFIYEMLSLSGTGLCSQTQLLGSGFLSTVYGPNAGVVDRYLDKKLQNNVDVSFNVEQIVNDIDVGLDSLANYAGPELSLLQEEIDYRGSADNTLSVLDLATRYNFYRKQKIVEYAEFVDNMVFLPSNFSCYMTYGYDTDYLTMTSAQSQYCIKNINASPTIDDNAVSQAAITLAHMTQYIAKLRETLKLQTRKIFMKGTNNLMQYTANEFLIDYIETQRGSMSDQYLSAFALFLSAHMISDVYVQEYWDLNEYMNISTDTTRYAHNKKLANGRYFDETFQRENGLLVPSENNIFTNEDLNQFYLHDLGFANTLHPILSGDNASILSSNLYEFLSVLFDVAADRSYYSLADGSFHAKLSNDILTEEIMRDLSTILSVQSYVEEMATSAGYEFDSTSALGQQVKDFAESVYYVVRDEHLEGISTTYETYYPTVDALCAELATLANDLTTFIEKGPYSSYFCKSESLYSYNDDGTYAFPYYVGNLDYIRNNCYEMSAMSVREWINADNCYTLALSTAIDSLSAIYDDCKAQIDDIGSSLEHLDYISPNSDDLEADMDSIDQFINTKIQQRNTFLQSILQELRNQAANAKQEYDNIKNQFSSVLASLPNLPHQNFYMKPIGLDKAGYELVDPTNKADEDSSAIYDAISEAYYIYNEHKKTVKPMFSKASTDGYIDEKFSINDSDTLETQMQTCASLISFMANITYGAGTSAVKTIGSQKITIQTLQASLTTISTKTLPSISNRLKELLGKEIAQDANASCIDQISNTISYLTNNVSEQDFNNDTVIQSYYDTLRQLTNVSCDVYVPAKSSYEALWTEFDSFFVDFAKSSNYRSYIPDNIKRIDEYRKKKDTVALANINEQLDEFDAKYESYVKRFVGMCNDNKIMLYDSSLKQHRYYYTGEPLEFCIDGFVAALVEDIAAKQKIAENIAIEVHDYIDPTIKHIVRDLYKKYFPTYLKPYKNLSEYDVKFDAMTTSFLDIISSLVDRLQYTDSEQYEMFKMLFQNYSGVPGIATDPYYNIKNQTHPSYQIHPFMWNFIEWTLSQKAIDQISKKIVSLDYNAFESQNILSSIDLMVGKFGNMIDVWKSGIHDFTSYQTKYEASNHICKYTDKYSAVVGYEGGFYPPALDAYIKSKAPHGLNTIEKYYSHLNLNNNVDIKNKIDLLLQRQYESIHNITVSHIMSHIYDIYKYYVDAYENMYILYKVYNKDNPTEFEKLMTPGILYVRLADSPIAFEFSSIVKEAPSYLTDSNTKIYDMCMMPNGTALVIVTRSTDNKGSRKNKFHTRMFYISYETSKGCGVGDLSIKDYGIFDGKQFSTDDICPIDHSYKYIGSINSNANSGNAVLAAYVQCNSDMIFNSAGIWTNNTKSTEPHISDNPSIKLYLIQSNRHNAVNVVVDNNQLALSNIAGSAPAMSQHSDIDLQGLPVCYCDLLFATNDPPVHVACSSKGLNIDMVSAAIGYTYDDPIHASMNSLDFINGQLVLKSIRLPTSDNSDAKEVNTTDIQLNTDMGYLPSYAYDQYENVLDVKNDLCSSYQVIELLGKSKDISKMVANTNPDTDPYLTKKDLLEKYMYGRIYEDYDGVSFVELSDQSVNILENKSMYENMPNEYDGIMTYNYVNGHYQWTIQLNTLYSYEKLRKLRLFIYSTTSLGKNPYVVAEMSDVIDQSEKLPQNGFLSTNYNTSKYEITTYSFNDASFTISMNGTQNGINQVDSFFSNALPNISNFTFKYFKMRDGSMYLKLDFKLDNINADGYIDNGWIKIAFVDMFDLSFFNWYHYIDPGVTDDEYNSVINKIRGNPLLKEQLMNIDMSQYDYLSDVQVNGIRIFETNHRIQFKISEEDNFQVSSYNYYVPSLNTKYPLTMSQAYDKQYNVPEELLNGQIQIFSPDEVYELEVEDANVLDILGNVGLEFTDLDDDFRVYEDYWYGSESTIGNGKYSPNDPRFYQYVHMFANNSSSSVLSIQPSACVDVRVCCEYETDTSEIIDSNDVFSQAIDALNLKAMHGEDIDPEDRETYVRDFNFKSWFNSISDADKQKFREKIKKFFRLHFNYAKTKDGIELYVNYANYINSPYVKLVDGHPYLSLIEGTYLKLKTGENGLIDIVIQFKQLVDGILMAVKNIVVATFKVYNVSDDKPKFILEKLARCDGIWL